MENKIMVKQKTTKVEREGRGHIRKHPDMERYYVQVFVNGVKQSAVVFSVEEGEEWIRKKTYLC